MQRNRMNENSGKRKVESGGAICEARPAARPWPALGVRASAIQNPKSKIQNRKPRRGVLLLVVLSLLTLFLLVGTAFLITAKQTEQASKAQARAAHNATQADSRGELLDEVVRQLVRDTDNVQSSLRSHSLLADMYGNDGFTATIGSVQWANPTLVVAGGTGPPLAGNEANLGGVTAGQLVRFTIYESNNDGDSRNPHDLFGNVLPRNTIITPGTPPVLGVPRLSAVEDAYAGQTLTFISAGSPAAPTSPASARGVTTRIVRYRPANISTTPPTPATITVLAFPLADGSRLQDIDDRANAAGVTALRALDGSRILINGRPFNGTGAGLNSAAPAAGSPRLTVQEDLGLPGYPNPQPLALLPNSVYFNPRQLGVPGSFPVPVNTLLEEYLPTVERNLLVVRYGANISAARATDAAALLDRVGLAGVGSANESYDAPDFQNMALAMMPLEDYRTRSFIETNLNIPNPTVSTPPSSPGLFWVDAAQSPPQVHSMVLPSFHRPELLNHFWNNGSGPLNVNASLGGPYQFNPSLLRRVMLRPSPLDHPLFSGSNPEFEAQRSAYVNNPMDSTNAVQQNLINRLIHGPWDVDNDKDGVRDSVWIDFGAPVMTGPNGRLVKPLAAILCVDLDGRVNVNAATSLDLAQRTKQIDVDPNVTPQQDAAGNFLVLADNATNVASLPRGSGYGPADVNLASVHGSGDTLRLLTGAPDGNGFMPGRYGADLAVGGTTYEPKPGRSGFDLASQMDFAGWPQFADGQEYKQGKLYRRGSSFATPPDLRTRYGAGIDVFGQLVGEAARSNVELSARTDTSRLSGNLLYDSPYDVDLSNVASKGAALNAGPDGALLTADDPLPADMPFTLAEFERTQRVYDGDASQLPGRLFNLARFFNPNELPARLKITTDSFDVPAPNVSLPPEFDTPVLMSTKPEYRRLPRSFAEILEMRVRESLSLADFPEPLTAVEAQRVREIVRQIIAPELARGERLNVNRPLGNGRDDNGNGVVDEPYEWVGDFTTGSFAFNWDANGNLIVDGGANPETFAAAEAAVSEGKVWDVDPTDGAVQQMGLASAANAIGVVPAGGGVTTVAAAFFPPMAVEIVKDTVGNDPNGVPHFVDHRQLFARHLYVLALTLTADPGYTGKRTPGNTNSKYNDVELARRLAQWAVNVVDFRDPDNIMTGFEYDLNPFDGWDVDGNLGTIDRFGANGLPDVPGAGAADDRGGLVWGAERPELLITEAMAWHDRATESNQRNVDENSRDPRGTPSPEDEPHQQFRPRGAFFLELYNPWGSNPGVATDTHLAYPANGSSPVVDYGVNLAAVDRVAGKSPVWRLITYKDSLQANPSMPGTQVAKDPDNPFWNLRPGQQPLLLDRAVYFAGFDPEQTNPKWDNDGVAYYNSPNLPTIGSVRPGRYMVVGSGQETGPGSKIFKSPIGRKKNKDVTATQRQVELDVSRATNAEVRVADPVNPAQPPPVDLQPIDSRTSMCDVAIIDHVYDVADGYDDNENRTNGPKVRRLTLSEPPDGYKDRILNLEWDPKLLDPETGEGQYATGPAPHQPTDAAPVDVPLDDFNDKTNFNAATSGRRDGETRIPQAPAFITQFGAVYLQRLANPLLPWNPEPGTVKKGGVDQFDPARPVNPYLTVDDTLVGLSVFEGHDTAGKYRIENNKLRESFVSMERGWMNDPVDQRRPTSALVQQPSNSNYRVNPWRTENPWLNTGAPAPANAAKRNQKTAGNDFLFNASPEFTFGFLNRSFDAAKTASTPNRDGNLTTPFPNYPWTNRPYVSGPELMLAPRSRSSQLLHDFSMASTVAAGDKISPPYATPAVDRSLLQPTAAAAQPVAPFAGQENFFYEASAAKPAPPGTPSNLYRVFDYLQTPSLFAGTETWLNPQTFSDTQSIISRNQATDPRLALQAPFNSISTMREPGKVNLNTVASQSVWDALFHGDASKNWRVKPDGDNSQRFVHRGPYWLDGGTTGFLQSRRGYGAKDAPILTLDPTMPTFFADPLRASTAADLVPIGSMVQKQAAAGNDLSGVEATLFRSLDPAADKRGDKVLFQAEPRNGAVKDVDDPLRNKIFESSPLTRIANLTTNRSNVYQVWVTIGFFEVQEIQDPATPGLDPATVNLMQQIVSHFTNPVTGSPATTLAQARQDSLFARVYPEGYMLTGESTDDSGQTTRMRGYYVIDRSIPVGFEPGQDLNSDQTVRLKRRIE